MIVKAKKRKEKQSAANRRTEIQNKRSNNSSIRTIIITINVWMCVW